MDCIINQMMTVAEYLGWDSSSLKPVKSYAVHFELLLVFHIENKTCSYTHTLRNILIRTSHVHALIVEKHLLLFLPKMIQFVILTVREMLFSDNTVLTVFVNSTVVCNSLPCLKANAKVAFCFSSINSVFVLWSGCHT